MASSIKFNTVLERSPETSGWHFLVIEKKTADKLLFKDQYKRVVCTINGGERFQCALMPSSGKFYIIVNKKKRDALGIAAGDKVKVELVIDESKYGLPMPAEFREVLDQDPEGDKLFHSLTAGKQRSLLYFIGNVKDIDKRIHQSLVIIEHLKNNGKVIDKLLYEELKRPMY
ncbi:MAG: YdeI/OmpD-associated family protein [Pyrinomonadaceae bacterium]